MTDLTASMEAQINPGTITGRSLPQPTSNKVGTIVGALQSLSSAVDALEILRRELQGGPDEPAVATPPEAIIADHSNGGISVGTMLNDLPKFLISQSEMIVSQVQLMRETLI